MHPVPAHATLRISVPWLSGTCQVRSLTDRRRAPRTSKGEAILTRRSGGLTSGGGVPYPDSYRDATPTYHAVPLPSRGAMNVLMRDYIVANWRRSRLRHPSHLFQQTGAFLRHLTCSRRWRFSQCHDAPHDAPKGCVLPNEGRRNTPCACCERKIMSPTVWQRPQNLADGLCVPLEKCERCVIRW